MDIFIKIKNMNTHIIIPIAELNKIYKGKKDPTYDEVLLEAEEIFKLLNRSKKISLDEKDIEERANKQIFTGLATPQNSYKQALKDLL